MCLGLLLMDDDNTFMGRCPLTSGTRVVMPQLVHLTGLRVTQSKMLESRPRSANKPDVLATSQQTS